MMKQNWLQKAAASAGSALYRFRYYGSSIGAVGYSIIQSFLGDIDVRRRLGKTYDNSVVAAGVFWYWRNLTYPRIMVERPKGDGSGDYIRLPYGAFQKAIEHGAHYDHTVLFAGTLLSLICNGNAYWVKVRNNSGLVTSYAWIPHTRMIPMADKRNPDGTKLITYYRYTPIGGSPEELDPDDVVHLRFGIDPENPMLGLSPLVGALKDIVGDNEASTLSAALMINAGLTGVVISPKTGDKMPTRAPSPDQKDQMKDDFRRNTRGAQAGTPNFFEFPVDVVSMGYKPSEMVLDKHQAGFCSRICAGLGFDPMILGLPSDSKTYSNFAEAIEAAWENTLLPMLEIIGIQLTHQTLDDYPSTQDGDRVSWDTSRVRALQPDLDKLFGRLNSAYVAGWLMRSETKQLAINAGIRLTINPERDDVYSQELSLGPEDSAAKAKSVQYRQGLAKRMQRSREVYETLQSEIEA